MKNVIACKNCGFENPFQLLICRNCNSFLRDKIFNLDFWKIIALLIYSPVRAFSLIIYSQHKNYVIPINILISIKFLINSIFILMALGKEADFKHSLFLMISVAGVSVIVINFLYALLLKMVGRIFGLITRYKDYFAVITYSQVFYIFALMILFPIELVLFGEYLFRLNPSPFEIKSTLAYTLLVFEMLVIIWSLLLLVTGFYVQSRNILYSSVTALVYYSISISLMYQFVVYLYN